MPVDQRTIELLTKYTSALSVALGYRDLQTRLHSERVARLSVELGMMCALSSQELAVLRLAAAVHDIGKIGIPDHILSKTSRLGEDDWDTIHQHPSIGADILLAAEFDGAPAVAAIVRHHHENHDGSGYPDRLSNSAIPLGARIVSIVDAYDAMAEPRPYHRQRHHRQIMDILDAETGTKRDPDLMPLFIRLIENSDLSAG
jgi:HD-GYP domain-containing protein (c-di-GMP phosphodiesterase class II)